MITRREARDVAFALPETVEQDHHGIPSLRVRGKTFATVADADHIRIMVGESDIRATVAEDPAASEEFWRGSRLACVVVDVRLVARELMEELLVEEWRCKAPRGVVRRCARVRRRSSVDLRARRDVHRARPSKRRDPAIDACDCGRGMWLSDFGCA